MKRAGFRGRGWSRLTPAPAALVLGLALSPALAMLPTSAAASQPPMHAARIAATAPTEASTQLATYAGVPAAGKPTGVAQEPFGLAVSGRYTFVADPINHAIRLLVDNGETVFAGNGSMAIEGDGGSDLARTQLVGPYAVAVGHVTQNGPFQVTAFDVYIADTFANEIRKVRVTVNPVGGPTAFQKTQICTLAGSGTANFASDGDTTDIAKATFKSPYGLAWDDNHDLLYVADTGNNRIRVIHDPNVISDPNSASPACQQSTIQISTLLGPAVLKHPRGLAVDAGGRLYIADTYNNAVRIYDPGFDPLNPTGPAVRPASRAVVAGSSSGVPGFAGDGHAATSALLSAPAAVAVDAQDNIYIADTGNQVVREVTPDGVIRTVAGTPKTSGASNDPGPALTAKLSSPMAVAVRPNGDVVIADTGHDLVRILEAKLASGSIHNLHTEAGNGTASFSGDGGVAAAAQFGAPAAVLTQIGAPIDAAVPTVTGTRYVLDTFNQVVRRYHSGGRTQTSTDNVATLAGGFSDPMGMALDATRQKLYVADTFNSVVEQIDLGQNGSAPTSGTIFAGQWGSPGYEGDGQAPTSARLSYPTGIAVDPAGNVFIADTYNGVVREVTNHKIVTVAGTGLLGYSGDGGPATQAGLYFPYGLALDSANPPNLYISDSFDHRIRRVDGTSHIITTAAGDGAEAFADGSAIPPPGSSAASAHFDRPWGLTVNQGSVFVADYLNQRLRQVDLTGGTVTTIAGTGNPGLNNSVLPPDSRAGPTPDSGPALSGELNGPRGVAALGDTGALLIADSFNNRIRWLGIPQAGIQRTQVNFDPTNLSSESSPQSVTVTSTGTGLLVMGKVDLAQSLEAQNFSLDSSTNNCANARLEAGSNCSFQVIFKPRSLGSHLGSVLIPNDALGGAKQVVLNGRATAALVTLAPPAAAIYQAPNGTSTPAVVSLTNNGSGLLEVKLIRVIDGTNPAQGTDSSFFSQSNSCPQFLQAKASCAITISLNQLDPADQTTKIATLVVQDDAAGSPVNTQIVPVTGGLAQAQAMLNRQELAFAQNIGTNSAAQSFVFTNSGQVPMHLFQIHEDGDFSQTNNCPQILAPNAGCVINVIFQPGTIGERDGYVVVTDDSPDSPQRIPVMGVATMPSAQLTTGTLAFTANVGAAASPQSVRLINRGDGPLTIGAITATGDFHAQPQCPPVLLPGISCTIGVTFSPHNAGGERGSLVVIDDSNAVPGSQQSILLSGTAYQPLVALSTGSLSAATNLGGSITQTVGLTNTGNGPLSIRGMSIGGGASGDWSQANTCPPTLQPSASCVVTVEFTPRATGARNATLTIDDDAGGGAQSVALRGVGTAPRPVLSGSYLNFGGQAVGSRSAPQAIVLFNAGNGPLSISSITASGPDYLMGSTCGPTLAAGASCRITVSFLPQARGPRSGLVTVVDSAGGRRFTLTGVGT